MAQVRYPDAPRLDVVDVLHGRRVADPYRWLEAASAETEAWAKAQDGLVRGYLDGLPGRDHLKRRLTELMPGMISAPAVRGQRSFFYKRLPGQDLMTYNVREADGSERVLVDPNEMSPDHTINLDAAQASLEGDRIAVQLSHAGRELSTLHIYDVDSGEELDDPVDIGRPTGVAWLPGGEELVYVRRLPDLPEDEEQFHRRVWRRRVGSSVGEDVLLFGEGRDKITYYGVSASRDGRWLTVSCHLGTAPRNDLYITALGRGSWTPIIEGLDAQAYASFDHEHRLYLATNLDAPRMRLCTADPADPGPRGWRELLPESDLVFEDYAVSTDAVIAVRARRAVSEIAVHDRDTGEQRGAIELPGAGTAQVVTRLEGGTDVWIVYTDHVTPMKVLHHDLTTGSTTTWSDAPGAVTVPDIRSRQVTYRSKDGTEVGLFVIARDDVERNGATPTLLNGYGGFQISETPAYSSQILAWVEQGGVYAIACLRGGGEEGEEWHRAGMRANKQNVFDDFIAAGEHLIAEGYTSSEHLGITGGSNGGLLVGATMTQRPDLMRSVVCSAPLLDMIRYELFGLGVTWNDEYGTVEKADELEWLLGYSPYHHVKEGTAYPAVLFTVFDNDTRVDPLHARKMCAAVQHATTSDADERPVLLRREVDVGHGARSVGRTVDLGVDTLSFQAAQLGLPLPD